MKKSSLVGHTAELYATILNSSRPADHLIDQFFRSRKYLGSNDRRFIGETTYGILRYKKRVDWLLSAVSRDAIKVKTNEFARGIFSVIAYLFLEKKESPNVVLEELRDLFHNNENEVEQFLNYFSEQSLAVPVLENTLQSFALQFSFEEWMIEEWIKQFGIEETKNLCETLNSPAPITLRVNTLKSTRLRCSEELQKENVAVIPTTFSPIGLRLEKRVNVFQLESFRNGFFEVQDEGSQLLALVADPKPRSKVIDACAGAGGKSLAMAAQMNNRGEIFALDVHSGRLDDFHKRIKRAGVDIVRKRIINEGEVISEFNNFADYVLVDAPCSGTGTIRRNPGMKWSVTPQMISEMHDKQLKILTLNSLYVKNGGTLIYATCSLMKHENENVVEEFLSHHPEFELSDIEPILKKYNLATQNASRYFQLLPNVYGTDGFFAAVMRKKK